MNKNLPRAFIDTNVLAKIIGNTNAEQTTLKPLRDAGFEVVTFAKCVYELYSIIKGTTRGGASKKNHPLKHLIPAEVNDIAQRLFKKEPEIDALGNSYYWYNLTEEWQDWDYCGNTEEKIEEILDKRLRDKAYTLLQQQKDFVLWKQGMLSVFRQVDSLLKEKDILVCQYFQIFSSDWYNRYGFFYEQELAQNSLLPNEDFEIILSALFLNARVFITEDDKDLIWRGGLSLGLNMPKLAFCCPERIEEAIKNDFDFRFYRKK